MAAVNRATRHDALLDAAAAADAIRIAAVNGEKVDLDVDVTQMNKVEAAKIMSEEHKILGYRPPADSLAAKAQAAADKNPDAGGTMSAHEEAKLVAAAAEDALRISAERGQYININVNPASVSKDEASKIMSEEHRILGHRPPPGSLASISQSAADKKENAETMSKNPVVAAGVPVTKELAAEVQSEAANATVQSRGGQVPKGSFASHVQSVADRNANDGGKRTIYDA